MEQPTPLAPATLHILLALSGGDLHGYGIMQEILRQTEGRYKVGPGTLYDNLQRLLEQGFVEEIPTEADSRRRIYRLSPNGKALLRIEVQRLESVVRAGRTNLGMEGA